MLTPVSNIIYRATNEDKKYNGLTFCTHERYQSNLQNVNSNFWLIPFINEQITPGVKHNNWVTSYASMPNNHFLLSNNGGLLESIPSFVEGLDFTFGQHRFGQAQVAINLANYLGCKSIVLEHTTVTNNRMRESISEFKKIRGDINVFISSSSCEAWGWDLNDSSVRIIEHGVNTELFKPSVKLVKRDTYPHILSIVNDWVNRGDILGWDIFNRVVINNKLPFKILGDNPGISQPAKNVYELVNAYRDCSVFYNTSRHSPIPTVILEAMACEIPCVSTDNYLISEIIIDGYNGYKTNNENKQLAHLKRLLNDKDERIYIGKNARKTIEERFNLSRFTKQWNDIIEEVSQ